MSPKIKKCKLFTMTNDIRTNENVKHKDEIDYRSVTNHTNIIFRYQDLLQTDSRSLCLINYLFNKKK